MVYRVLALSIVASIATFALSARAEEPASKPPSPPVAPSTTGVPASTGVAPSNPNADLAGRVDDLERKAALLERSNKALSAIVDSNSTTVADLKMQIARLQQEKEELTNIANDHSKMLRDIVTTRATPEGGQRFVPNVQAIRADRDSRRELVDTVAEGLTRSSGTLRIRNDMSTVQSLVINGVTTIFVPPHEGLIVPVPSGTATTELAGEGTKSWMVGAPTYNQDVVIAPAVRSTVGSWVYDPATGGWFRTLP